MNKCHKYLSRIPNDWLETRGKNVRIGICDNGCRVAHPLIKHAIKEYKNFGEISQVRHGTHVAGIIVSKRNNINSMVGLASDSEVYMANISSSSGGGYRSLKDALSWIYEFDVDVLNLSLAYLDDNKEIYDMLFKMSSNMIILAAHSFILKYPHEYSQVISVGVEGQKADLITEGEFVWSCPEENFKRMTGTSMATAYASSVACLAKSFDPNIDRDEFLLRIRGDKKINPKNFMKDLSSRQIDFRID